MSTDADFAEWAAMFLQRIDAAPATPTIDVAAPEQLARDYALHVIDDGLSPDARALLHAVDTGGVPAFMTNTLKRIALEHGLTVVASTTPNDIIFALQQRRQNAL